MIVESSTFNPINLLWNSGNFLPHIVPRSHLSYKTEWNSEEGSCLWWHSRCILLQLNNFLSKTASHRAYLCNHNPMKMPHKLRYVFFGGKIFMILVKKDIKTSTNFHDPSKKKKKGSDDYCKACCNTRETCVAHACHGNWEQVLSNPSRGHSLKLHTPHLILTWPYVWLLFYNFVVKLLLSITIVACVACGWMLCTVHVINWSCVLVGLDNFKL